MYDLKEPLFDIINEWNDGVHLRVAYQAMMLHSLCRDEEWKRRFVTKGGMDHLLQMLFHAVLCLESHKLESMEPESMEPESMEQESALLMVSVTNILYEICYGHCTEYHPRHLFLQKVLSLRYPKGSTFIVPITHSPTNLLIHIIRTNAASDTTVTALDFIDDLPRNIVSVFTLPLIVGYLRNGGISLLDIPDEISQLIAFFF